MSHRCPLPHFLSLPRGEKKVTHESVMLINVICFMQKLRNKEPEKQKKQMREWVTIKNTDPSPRSGWVHRSAPGGINTVLPQSLKTGQNHKPQEVWEEDVKCEKVQTATDHCHLTFLGLRIFVCKIKRAVSSMIFKTPQLQVHLLGFQVNLWIK